MRALVAIIFAFVLLPILSVEAADSFQISVPELRSAIFQDMNLVPEFVALRQLAKKHNVRLYLFGGSASSWAHYEYWYLRHKEGDPEIYPNRLDHAFDSIYSPLEDADLVACGKDGSPIGSKRLAAIQRDLEGLLQNRKVDVYGLHETWSDIRGNTRMALADDWNFLNQNLDSQSVILIDVSAPSEERIIDLTKPSASSDSFLDEIIARKIRFYRNSNHSTTERAKAGDNPEILSVIRLLTKAFRYDLSLSSGDSQSLRDILQSFDPSQAFTAYVQKWLKSNTPKLFSFVVDLEKAWKTADRLGLRKKLVELPFVEQRVGDITSIMHRLPLPSRKLGPYQGAYSLQPLAHETSPLVAKSMTWSIRGIPAVFLSSQRAGHGIASGGDGFYLKPGSTGNGKGGSGAHIVFYLHPGATSGKDFTPIPDYRVTNRDALILPRQTPRSTAQVLLEFLNANGRSGVFDFVEYFADAQSDKAQSRSLVQEIESSPLESLKLGGSTDMPEELRQLIRSVFISKDGEGTTWLQKALETKDIETLPLLHRFLEPKDIQRHSGSLNKALEKWIERFKEKMHAMKDHSLVMKLIVYLPEALNDPAIRNLASQIYRETPHKLIPHILNSFQNQNQLKSLLEGLSTTEEQFNRHLDLYFRRYLGEANLSQSSRVALWKQMLKIFDMKYFEDGFKDALGQLSGPYFFQFNFLGWKGLVQLLTEIPELQKSKALQSLLLKWSIFYPTKGVWSDEKNPSEDLIWLRNFIRKAPISKRKIVRDWTAMSLHLNTPEDALSETLTCLRNTEFLSKAEYSKIALEAVLKTRSIYHPPFLKIIFHDYPEWLEDKRLREALLYSYLYPRNNAARETFADLDGKSDFSQQLRSLIKRALEDIHNDPSTFRKTYGNLDEPPIASIKGVTQNTRKTFGVKAATGLLLLFTQKLIGQYPRFLGRLLQLAPSLKDNPQFKKDVLKRIRLEGPTFFDFFQDHSARAYLRRVLPKALRKHLGEPSVHSVNGANKGCGNRLAQIKRRPSL